MASFNVDPCDKFSFKPNDWPKWITRFERFRIASELDKKPEETQVAILIYSMSDNADDIFRALPMTADERKKYAKFNLRFQKENECR